MERKVVKPRPFAIAKILCFESSISWQILQKKFTLLYNLTKRLEQQKCEENLCVNAVVEGFVYCHSIEIRE